MAANSLVADETAWLNSIGWSVSFFSGEKALHYKSQTVTDSFPKAVFALGRGRFYYEL